MKFNIVVMLNKNLEKLRYKIYNIFIKQNALFIFFYITLKDLYDYLTINSKGNVFKFLFNFRAFLSFRSKGIRITKEINKYYVLKGKLNENDIKWTYSFEKFCYYHLRDGFDFRVKILSKEYCLNLINFEEGDNILDVGANTGDFYLCLMNLGIANLNYFAFEPAPLTFLNLKRNIESNKVINSEIFNIGLWNQDKKLKFYLAEDDFDSSFIFPKNKTSSIEIEGKRLSNIIKEPVKLLKLEAEGAEPEVLEGIGDKLGLIEYIAADLGFERGLRSDSTIPEVSNYLIPKGFDLITISSPRLICLFKNRNFNI